MQIRKRGQGYQLDYVTPEGKRVRRQFSKRKDAKDYAETMAAGVGTKNGKASARASQDSLPTPIAMHATGTDQKQSRRAKPSSRSVDR